MKKLNLTLWCFFALAMQSISAQTFTSIDIQTGTASSYPQGMTTFNGKVYFSAKGDTAIGNELWASDGTSGGTALVKDIYPGNGNSNPSGFVALGNKLFFTANDGTHGQELWVTDGTSAGTTMVSDIWLGAPSSYVSFLTPFNGKLYFSANDSVHGYELWVTDGTSAGTSIVKDINPGINNSSPQGYAVPENYFYYAYLFNEYNGKLYFRANDGVHGIELWSTDGTTSGTTMLADIQVGLGSSNPYFMTPYNGKLIFSAAADTIDGYEVWITDGTSAGTSMLKNINPGGGHMGGSGSDAADYSGYVPFNGKLYFTAYQTSTGYELWTTDGTTAGTSIVKDIWLGPGSSYAGGTYALAPFNGKLFFNANDSVNGNQLWATDGTSAGTTLLKVISSYTPYYGGGPGAFVTFGDQLVFRANIDTLNKTQLWVTDGTTSGTHIIAPAIAPNNNPLGYFSQSAILNGKLFFDASFNSIGNELWIYSFPLAITPVSADHAITASPNPFSSSLTIKGLTAAEHYTIQVLDMTGREHYSTEVDNESQSTLTLPELSTGVYLMHISGQNSNQTFKLVKN